MDKKKIEKAVRMILEAVGEDVKRSDLIATPRRVAEMYEEVLSGMKKDPRKELEVIFEKEHNEIVLLKNIPLYSICEHHLVPFLGKAHVAYIPDGNRVTGLSKLARVVDTLSRRLQVQERLTTEIANVMMQKLKPKGVMVIIEAEHLCMSMRGVKKPGVLTITSAVRGVFRQNEKTRAEAMALIAKGLGKGANYDNTLVIGKNGPVKNAFRFSNEPVRHKVLDLIGDLYLLGMPLKGHVIALKSGHRLNMELVRRLKNK